ncbi:MAG: protein kinase domain-containing protein, partial [Actinomycetota bacterium]
MSEERPRRVLAGRYEIASLLGQGGMARVFRGTDRVLDRTVAIKVLSPQFADDDQFVARFRREAQAAAGLNHPNIVGVYDTGDQGDVHFIVMEYVEGRTLRDVIRGDGPLLPERAAEIGEAVARALSSAHQAGLVHRDIKPGNIMLTREGEVKVMD